MRSTRLHKCCFARRARAVRRVGFSACCTEHGVAGLGVSRACMVSTPRGTHRLTAQTSPGGPSLFHYRRLAQAAVEGFWQVSLQHSTGRATRASCNTAGLKQVLVTVLSSCGKPCGLLVHFPASTRTVPSSVLRPHICTVHQQQHLAGIACWQHAPCQHVCACSSPVHSIVPLS